MLLELGDKRSVRWNSLEFLFRPHGITMISHLGALLALSLATSDSTDWPTYLGDNSRSGHADAELSLPLHPHWTRKLPHRPKPAWPNPAKQDFWHRKTSLNPRVTYDRANQIVVASQRVVFGSSADDQIRCLNARTGELHWTFFSEAPIRLAPTIWNASVIFGADDGYVYSVSLDDGQLNWRTRPNLVGPRKIPGNGRIISERPIRTNVLIENGTGYFAAGLFPNQGCFFFSVDLASGRVLDHARLEISPQGYLSQRKGKLFAPTGRDPTGAILATLSKAARRSADNDVLRLRNADDIFCVVSDHKHYFIGRQDKVHAISRKGLKPVWESPVNGRAYALALADRGLFVSTDQGNIYRFGELQLDSKTLHPQTGRDSDLPADSSGYLAPLESGRGFALWLQPSHANDLIALARKSELQIVAIVFDEKRADRIRRKLAKAAFYGRIVVHVMKNDEPLPYAANTFDLIIGGNRREHETLLCPGSGIGFFKDQERYVRRAPLEKTGEWTHTYGDAGNTSCSGDSLVRGDLQLQWFGEPGPRKMVDRHLRTMPPLVSAGRMFIPARDRVIAVNAYNGTILWETEVPQSTRIGVLKDCGWMATDADSLLVAQTNKCLVLDPSTGSVVKRINVPDESQDWGYTALSADKIFGSMTHRTASRRKMQRESILEGAYSDNRPIVTSNGIFAIDRDKYKTAWRYHGQGAILNPTIGTNSRFVFFVEKRIDESKTDHQGRYALNEFFKTGQAEVVAIDSTLGTVAWRTKIDAIHAAQNMYLMCTEREVIVVNSRNGETVLYDVRVYDANDGDIIWRTSQKTTWRTGGDHGEQDKHPVLIGQRLVIEPECYDLRSGKKFSNFRLQRTGHGCGTLSASADAIFFRSKNAAGYQMESGRTEVISKVSRPGCWINMIPASGLLLIPEASSGCTCNVPIQCSMAFAPKSP